MAVETILFERGGNAAVWICRTSLLFWTTAFNLETAGFVQCGPFQSRILHWLCFAGDHVSDTELMLGMSGGADRDAHHTGLGIQASEHQRVAPVLVINLIEKIGSTGFGPLRRSLGHGNEIASSAWRRELRDCMIPGIGAG